MIERERERERDLADKTLLILRYVYLADRQPTEAMVSITKLQVLKYN